MSNLTHKSYMHVLLYFVERPIYKYLVDAHYVKNMLWKLLKQKFTMIKSFAK
jgi:hypothetical protein